MTGPTTDLSPLGVEKQSFVTGLYAEGNANGYYAPAGTNSQADLTTWYADLNAGEPYDGNAAGRGARHPDRPVPLAVLPARRRLRHRARRRRRRCLIANGFTDDLFPVDEAVRYYNLEHSLYPSDPISLFDGDFGHQPANNKPGDLALLSSAIQSYFDYYLKGIGRTAAAERDRDDRDLPGHAALRRSVHRADLGGPAPRRGRLQLGPGPDDLLVRRQPGDRQDDRPDRGRRRVRHRERHRPGRRRRDLPPPGLDRLRVHACSDRRR